LPSARQASVKEAGTPLILGSFTGYTVFGMMCRSCPVSVKIPFFLLRAITTVKKIPGIAIVYFNIKVFGGYFGKALHGKVQVGSIYMRIHCFIFCVNVPYEVAVSRGTRANEVQAIALYMAS
jgi:hypothetical protein